MTDNERFEEANCNSDSDEIYTDGELLQMLNDMENFNGINIFIYKLEKF